MPKKERKLTGGWPRPGGWKGNIREASEAITLPETLVCALCEREMPLKSFSPSALRRLRSAIRQNGVGVLVNQQVARCDSCGTQSRPELHCMSCNKVRPINEFAHTQCQYDQPVCLPCQDDLQIDERDKLPVGQPRKDEASTATGQIIEETLESAPACITTTAMTGNDIAKESGSEKNMDPLFEMREQGLLQAYMWSGNSASSSSARRSLAMQPHDEDMDFDAVFEDDEENSRSGSWQW